jgi:hypothetical protein
MTLKEKVCEPFDGLKKETADKIPEVYKYLKERHR